MKKILKKVFPKRLWLAWFGLQWAIYMSYFSWNDPNHLWLFINAFFCAYWAFNIIHKILIEPLYEERIKLYQDLLGDLSNSEMVVREAMKLTFRQAIKDINEEQDGFELREP